jgi:tetratricopeptide (TPR) repeat protein
MAMDKEDSRGRLLKYELLVALDRPKALEEALRTWIAGDGPENRWRIALGYLLAEQGKLPEAIKLFQAVAAADELGPAEYRAMADWHMAVNDRGQYEAAIIAFYKVMPENQLHNLLNQKVRPWQQSDGKLPSELDKDVLLILAAALEKTGNPQNYTWTLQQFYRGSRDFRLLAGVSDAAVGHTAGYVYPLLESMRSLLTEVRDEATADSIVEQLAKVRKRAKTDVDHRALDLLELLVERRAAELLNQPGPHVQRALAAMQRAFKRKWSDGEPRLMAQFLENLGAISQPKLAEEQLRQLRSLHAEGAQGSVDRLYIARHLANVLWVLV